MDWLLHELECGQVEELDGVATGQAEIESVFALIGRGVVLVLKDGFSGTIDGPGIVRSDRGVSAFAGPEFVDGLAPSGGRKSWLAVIAQAANAAELFQPDDMVSLFRKS